jgi:Glycoside Hydrolase Family 113
MWLGFMLLLLLLAAVMFDNAIGTRSAAVETQPHSAQRGFALPTWEEGGYDSAQVEQAIREMAEVGATWVQLTPTWYQETRNASEVARSPGTVSDAGLERAIRLAHEQGLKVFLKPHLDLPNPGQDSRNNIRPDNRVAWFTSYTAFIDHYAEMAEKMGVEQFAVATELSSITDDRAAWLKVIQTVRARYQGTVTYAANVDEYMRVPFWDAVDVIGIDAYWALSDASTTDVLALQRAWEPIRAELAALSAKHGRQILFTEAGYTNQEGTTTSPSDWRLSTTSNQTEQAAAYHALLATFSDQAWWAGVHWWVWNALPYSDDEYTLDFSPHGKLAEWVIRGWWAK